MYLLLREHSPRPAQAPQYWLKSSQRSQRPHAMGQWGSIQAGLLEHSDSEAQLAQYLHTGAVVRGENTSNSKEQHNCKDVRHIPSFIT